jgi:cyclopropane fatty-acyl-phospholipid synthase-like methyltransferase
LSVAGPPGRALELGCGDGRDAIFLAQNGFEVTAVDFSPTALKMARINARKNVQEAGISVNLLQDDVTKLCRLTGTFDLVVDIGAFNDLSQHARELYMDNVVPLTHSGSRYFLMCFERKLATGEIERRFGGQFKIESLLDESERPIFPGVVLYSMVRE